MERIKNIDDKKDIMNKKRDKKGVVVVFILLFLLFFSFIVQSQNQIQDNTEETANSDEVVQETNTPTEQQSEATEEINKETDEVANEEIKQVDESKQAETNDDTEIVENAGQETKQADEIIEDNNTESSDENEDYVLIDLDELIGENSTEQTKSNKTALNPDNETNSTFINNQTSSNVTEKSNETVEVDVNDTEKNPEINYENNKGDFGGGIFGENKRSLDSNETKPISLKNLSNDSIEYKNLEDVIGEESLNQSDDKEKKKINTKTKISENENSWKKEVVVSSEEHIEEPITVYSDIKEAENVKIYWLKENEKIEITGNSEFEVNFYDSDDNGKNDRVSWIVPHLSVQTFEIVIDFRIVGNESLSIQTIKPENSLLISPVEFEFNISHTYIENLKCNLSVNDISFNFNNINGNVYVGELDFDSGDYAWKLYCIDDITKENASVEGNFFINTEFDLEIPDKVYLIDDKVNFTIYSEGETQIKIIHPEGYSDERVVNETYPYTYLISQDFINKRGVYYVNITTKRFAEPYSLTKSFSVAEMDYEYDKDVVATNEDVTFSVNIDSPFEDILFYSLEFGDGTTPHYETNNLGNKINEQITHQYAEEGVYTTKLTAAIDGKMFTIQKNGIAVLNEDDGEAPVINLISPDDDAVINENSIDFVFKASDNVKVKNCTFELYNKTGSFGVLIFSETDTTIENNEELTITIDDFVEGDYSWYVGCYDDEANYNEKGKDFFIRFSNSTINNNTEYSNETLANETLANETLAIESIEEDYEKKEEIENLLDQINNFLGKESGFAPEVKEVSSELEISKNINLYKKQLLQYKIDLKDGLKFMRDDVLKQQRKQEILDSIDEMKGKIPSNIRIISDYEYVKNSITADMEEITKSYVEAENLDISNREIRKLAEKNLQLQKTVSFPTTARHVEIDYGDNLKEITLVSKQVEMKNNSVNIILEVIPKEIAESSDEITFLVETKIINKDPILKMDLGNLENKKIVYYFEGYKELKNLENTETIIFDESLDSLSGITGFAVADLTGGGFIWYFLIVIFLGVALYLGYFSFKTIKISKWKKEENVRKGFRMIKKAKNDLKNKEVEGAREKYHRLKELYPLFPESCRKYIYNEIKDIQTGIDKKDAANLIKEYNQAKTEGREQDALEIYEELKSIYKRLPKDSQAKVYSRVFTSK